MTRTSGGIVGGRRGATLPELILVTWLFGLVLAGLAAFAGAQGRLVALARDRARTEEAVRVGQVVLGSELRALSPKDVSAFTSDSIRIRAFRGSGRICGAAGSELLVRYEGVRRPEPDKDSVLIIGSFGEGPVAGLLSVLGDSSCGGTLRLRVHPEPPEEAGGFALVFETGSYSLSGNALRYRRGAGGRQPLTEAVLDSRSALERDPRRAGAGAGEPLGLMLKLRFRAEAFAGTGADSIAVVRLRSPNGAPP